MNEKEAKTIRAPGHYLNHLERTSNPGPMRIDVNLGYGKDATGAVQVSADANDRVWIRIREDTPPSTGGCETAICLSIEEADRLHSRLLDLIHYALPERRQFREGGQHH